MDNTLDDLLPDLRRLLPASLHGAYLDGYVRRRRTPMELLLSRSLPNTHVAASTFEDARAEIQALRMPQWVANRYLSEVEQALAVGQDTREVVGRAKAWMATGLVNGPRDEADFAAVLQLVRGRGAYYEGSGHRLAEGMTDEAVATRLWDAGFRAHMDLVEDGARLLRASHDVSTERPREAWDYKPPAVKATEPIDRFMAAYEPALYEALRKHPDEFSYTSAEVPDFLPRWRNTLLTKDFNHDGYAMRGACKRLGIKCTKQALLAFLRPGAAAVPQVPAGTHETRAATIVPATADAPAYTVHRPHLWASDGSTSKIHLGDAVRNCVVDGPVSAESVMRRRAKHIDADLRQRGLKLDYPDQVVAYVVEDTPREQEMDVVDAVAAQEEATEADRANMPRMQRLRAMAASPPSDLSGWGQRITDLYLLRMRPVKKLFGARGPTPAQQVEYDAEKKLWESLNRKARAEHKRLLADSNAGLPPPAATPRPTLPSPYSDVAKERHWRESTYRAESDIIADTFNEGAEWQAEAIRRVGTFGNAATLSIYPEQRGPKHVVAIATIQDGDVEIDWRDPGLTMAARNEISRRLRSATATGSDDAPSPLQDLIESTEKRALELGAKPARTRSIGRVTSDNPEERRLGEAVRDLRDRSDFDEAITWLEAAELNIPFDLKERTSELDAVDEIMAELWKAILDTSSIALGGVRGEGRGGDRVFYVSPEVIFDTDSLPFLLQRVMDSGPAALKEVSVKVIDPGDDDTYSAKVIDRDKALTNNSMVHANERGAHFIRSLYRNMKLLRDDLERAPKALDDVRKLLYWTGAMLDTPRCQDTTHSRALESFEAAKALYDEVRQRVVSRATTSDEVARIKAPLRKAAASAANLATECGEGQVDIFSAPRPPAAARQPAFAPPGFGLDPGTPWPTTRTPEPDAHKWTGTTHALNSEVGRLRQWFTVEPVETGTTFRTVTLRSREETTLFEGLPVGTVLTTVTLRADTAPEYDFRLPELRQTFIDLGRSSDQFLALRSLVADRIAQAAADLDDPPFQVGDHVEDANGVSGVVYQIEPRHKNYGGWTIRLNGPSSPWSSAQHFTKVPVDDEPDDDRDLRDLAEVTTKSFASRMPTKYLRNFFAEKDIPEVHWQLTDKSGVEHMISNLVVVEHMTQANKTDADAIGNMLRRLDFENRDVNGYLKHLAQGVVEQYEHDGRARNDSSEKSADTMREEFEEFERSAEQARAIFLPFPWVLPSRLANYSMAMRPGDPARFGDLPPLPAALVSKQIAALNKLPPDFLEALKRYMIEIVELSLEDVVRNGYGVWQSPAVLAEVGPANVKIVKMNRGGSGSITEIELNGSTHTLVRRKDGAILKSGAPPASAVRGNIYTSPAEIRGAITAYGAASRR